MKKNRTYLLLAAAIMLIAVFAGISTKSVAADSIESRADDAMFIFEQYKVQILNDTDDVSYIGYSNNDTNKNLSNKTQQISTDIAEPTQTTQAQAVEAAQNETQTKSVKELVWFKNGDTVFKKLTTAVVTDVLTGKSFTVIRKSGTNHADVEPLTTKDTRIMKSIYGGTWSWDRRAIWVEIGGQLYAGSMNGMPHGREIVGDNNFNGHFCIHFTGSRTHGTNRVDQRHQAAVQKALNTKP